MKLLVFSDIHGNGYAMEIFMKKLITIQYDKAIFCGDIFGYYYDQQKIMEYMIKIPNLIWIRGNHDTFYLELCQSTEHEEMYVNKYGSTYKNVREKCADWVQEKIVSLNDKEEIVLDGKRIGIFHGTPEDSLNGRLYPDNEIVCVQKYESYDLVILGHTHCRMERRYKNTLIVNSGSLGQPRDGNSFGYCIIDTDTMQVKFEDLEVNCDCLYEKIRKLDGGLDKLIEVLERRNKSR